MLKRFLRLIALAFLFQMSWAVASAYCLHESGSASQHFGHHAHQHQEHDSSDAGAAEAGADADADAKTKPEDKTTAAKKAASHPDCASCAHGGVGVFGWPGNVFQPALSDQPASAPAQVPAAPWLALPERPNWPHAALPGARAA